MKKLKTYKRFLESNSEDISEVMSVLNDMSLELRDKGFFVEQQSLSYGKMGVIKGFRIVVVKSNDGGGFMWHNTKKFYFQDIKENILEMTEYLESEGFSIDTIDFIDDSGVVDGILKDGNLYNNFSKEEVNHLTDGFIIRFIKSDKTNESSDKPRQTESDNLNLTNKFNFVIGKEYSFDELPQNIKDDIYIQFDEYSDLQP